MKGFQLLICSILLGIVTIWSCQSDSQQTTTQRERPHYPWAFRSVLDQQARMLTLALDQDMWVAYKVGQGALYKAWKGGVNFDGPVYTTNHGPQPISIGDAYTINEHAQPWRLTGATPSMYQYKGHTVLNDQVTLHHRVGDGQAWVHVDETVDAYKDEGGMPILDRTFKITHNPSKLSVVHVGNVHSIVVKEHLTTDGTIAWDSTSNYNFNNKELIEGHFSLTLNPEVTSLKTKFIDSPTLLNPNNPEEDEAEESSGLPEGAKLIAKSDCKTCHNKNVKTIGPAYVDVAKRYKNTEENVAMLVSKVKLGGTGKWGNQIMNAHPDLAESQIKSMVEYIMSLDAGQPTELEEASGQAAVNQMKPSLATADGFIPGLATSIYRSPKAARLLPAQSSLGKPIMGGILPDLGNVQGGQFVGLEDYFALFAEGYLAIDSAGEYTFRLWSDDGSKLFIEDQEIINNDGLHGTESVEGTASLSKGLYKIRVEFFQGAGGKYLSLDYKGPGIPQYVTIPRDAFYHDYDADRFAGLSLPMAVVTKIPGDKRSLEAVHPAFTLSQARPKTFTPKVGGLDFFSDGRMAVSTWDAAGSVYIVTNAASGDPASMTATKIAEGLAEPLGLKVVDDTIFIMQKQEMTKLVDLNGDGSIDRFETLSDAWDVSANFHEFGFGLAYKDDHFYATLATAIEPGGASSQPQIQDRGKVVRVNRKTGETGFIASGLRTPNGIGIGYGGDIYVADNQGDWLPASKIVHVSQGDWFGSRSVDPEGSKSLTEKKPVVWLPQDEIGNSPSTPLALNLGPYQNQMIHSEVTHGGVKRVYVEEVNGQYQGAVFRFIQGLEAGVNRMVWGPNGDLYVGGIGAPGNWGQADKLWYGLQRLSYNGTSVFEMLSVSARTNGVEITFTEPLQPGDGWDANSYTIKQWQYVPTADYGGPKVGEKTLPIKSVHVSEDRTKVFLELGAMTADRIVYVHLDEAFVSDKGNSLWSTEAWYTMNAVPQNKPGFTSASRPVIADNTLTDAEKAAGWALMFDGKSMDQWHNFGKTTIGSSWIVQNGAMHLNSVKKQDGGWQAADGGDIISKEAYENFELQLEWKIANCGNSGIMFNVVESADYQYPWQTGPEMQILDNTCHPDTRFRTHRAGDLYDMIETSMVTVKPAGEWNKVRLRSVNGAVEFWLNGYKVVDFTMHNQSWNDMIAKSKFKDMKGFGQTKSGHIALQDHGDKVWFKNVKIRRI